MKKLLLIVFCLVTSVLLGASLVGNFQAYDAKHKWESTTSNISGRFEVSSGFSATSYESYYYVQGNLSGTWTLTQNISLTGASAARTDWRFENEATPGIYKIVAKNAGGQTEEYSIFLSTTLTDIYVVDSNGNSSVNYSNGVNTFLTISFNAGAATDGNEISINDIALFIEILKDGVPYTGNKIAKTLQPALNRVDLIVSSGLESGVYTIRVTHPSNSDVYGQYVIFNQKYTNPPKDNLNDFLTVILIFLLIVAVVMFFLPFIANNMKLIAEQRKKQRELIKSGAYKEKEKVATTMDVQGYITEKKKIRSKMTFARKQTEAFSEDELSDVLLAEQKAAEEAMKQGVSATKADNKNRGIKEDKTQVADSAWGIAAFGDETEMKQQDKDAEKEEIDDEEDEDDEDDGPRVKMSKAQIKLEKEKLKMERERLQIEKERLQLEKDRLNNPMAVREFVGSVATVTRGTTAPKIATTKTKPVITDAKEKIVEVTPWGVKVTSKNSKQKDDGKTITAPKKVGSLQAAGGGKDDEDIKGSAWGVSAKKTK